MIHGVHHPALSVPDMQKALDFYCGVLGFQVVMEADLPAGMMETPFGIDKAECKIRMVNKVLHSPTTALREEAKNGRLENLSHLLKRLFRLP